MGRFLELRAVGPALILLATAGASAGDGPEVALPGQLPIVSRPSSSTNGPAAPAAGDVAPRAVLALPGLSAGPARPASPGEPTLPAADTGPAGPSLDAPLEMRPGVQPVRPPSGGPVDRPGRTLLLESTPMEEPSPLGGPATPSNPSSRRTTISTRNGPQPTPFATPSPARRARFFGLLPAPARPGNPQATTGPSSLKPVEAAPPGRSIVDDSRDEPSPTSALKVRIERQAREAVGDRAREIEVRVAGKEATVQARGVRLLQKRAVRKSLETLPALSGLRSTIEVND